MLNFAADLGIEDGDVAEYMWLCEEALSASVLGEWKAHADEEGSVYYHNGSTNSRRPPHTHPLRTNTVAGLFSQNVLVFEAESW